MTFPFDDDGHLITDEMVLVLEEQVGSGVTETTTERILSDLGVTQLIVEGAQGPAGPAGAAGSYEDEVPYSKRIDFVSDTLIYRGEAAVGAPESSPSWRIRRIQIGVDGDVTETWANGTALFDQVWTNRASLTYS